MKDSELVETISRAGVAIIPSVFDKGSLEAVEGELADRHSRRSRAGIRHALRREAVASLAVDPALLNLAHAVLGDFAFPYRATFFEKTATSNWLVVWHQDRSLPLRRRVDAQGWGPWSVKDGVIYAHAPASALANVLALRVHLDDSERDNGPLRVLPETHHFGVLTDDAIHDFAQQITPFDCIVPKGGVVAMRPLLVHASSKCQSVKPRRVLHIEYAASEIIGDHLEIAIT